MEDIKSSDSSISSEIENVMKKEATSGTHQSKSTE